MPTFQLAMGVLTPARLAGGLGVSALSGDLYDGQVTNNPGSTSTSIAGFGVTNLGGRTMAEQVDSGLGVSNTVDVVNNSHFFKIGDAIQIIGEELGFITTPSVHAAEVINNAGGGDVIAHSQGTSVFAGAAALLGDDILSNIDFRGFGGETFINQNSTLHEGIEKTL